MSAFMESLLCHLEAAQPMSRGAFVARDARDAREAPERLGITRRIPGSVFALVAEFCDAQGVAWGYNPEARAADGYPDLIFFTEST